jgi:NAD(P)-dependent dehydrogenase (short-subunit alcohol dehydrogenase family)
LVVGGSRGIGLGISKALNEAGAKVIIAARSAKRLSEAKDEIGDKVETVVLDVTDEAAVKVFFDDIGELDHVVTPAAVVNRTPFAQLTSAHAHQAFESKFWGQFNISKHGARCIKSTGSLTLFAGISSQKGFASLVLTSSINGAIEALTRSLALTLAPIRVNAISPGFIATEAEEDMNGARRQVLDDTARALPLKRVGTPKDIARGVLFLMESSFSTGSTLVIDGGHLAM